MNELALFAGAGGGLLASHLLGWRTVCAVEVNDYARSVLLARQNDRILRPFPIWDDVTTFDARPWRGAVDVVSGGFPCQPFSSAARGRHTAEDLWPEMLRVIKDTEPKFVFAENVSEIAINLAADDLQSVGYQVRCMDLSAADLGADHIRKRYWLLAHADINSQLLGALHDALERVPGIRPRLWTASPYKYGMAHGVAHRMDRLIAIGNGQVPAVAARAWRLLSGVSQ